MSRVPHGPSRSLSLADARSPAGRLLRLPATLALVGWASLAHAQEASNLRIKWLPMAGDTLVLDTLSVVPGSVHLFAGGLPVGETLWSLDPYAARIVWTQRPEADSILVRYRTLPLMLAGPKANKDPARLYAPDGDLPDPFKYVPPRQQADLFGGQGLNRSGSISRGVLFGNNQDLSVNSTLNLELSGRLTDRINVLASITDNTIPIQAGGNTLELQDFDQVFIKLYEEDERSPGNRWELIAGDIVLQRPRSHFLTYLKKTKGLAYGTRYEGLGMEHSTAGSVAISKGKFARNIIQGVEGVQGPYRLRGGDGELFIVVLSGTEQVYIDGQLLTRGQENDYVIDYNTAEVTFTARRMITKDRRISVEFQYSDRNYARSLVRVEHASTTPNGVLRVNVYSEQDHRNQPLQQQLTPEERDVLAKAGDDPLAAAVTGVDSTGFATDQVLYRRTDSLGYDPVFVFSSDPELAVWRLVFTQVGPGNGDYVQATFTPNGRVFRWVAPDTVAGAIVRRGDHAPIRVLITPRVQQMVTLGTTQRLGPRTTADVEFAFSRFDRNTFSDKDAQDDNGLGLLTRLEHAIPLGARDTTLRVLLGAELEAVSPHLRPVERYRPVEFERDWNLTPAIAGPTGTGFGTAQLLGGLTAGIEGRSMGRVLITSGTFLAGDVFQGYRQLLRSDLKVKRFEVLGIASWTTTQGLRESDFLRHKGTMRQRFKRITIGVQSEHERNIFRTDSLNRIGTGSYQFHEWEAFVQSPDTATLRWRLAGGQRWDELQRNGELERYALATSWSGALAVARNPRNRLGTTLTYRRLDILDSTLTAQRPENTYLARVEYDVTLWKGVAVFNTFYEFGAGLEQRREYIYIEVPAGQGLYVWIDYNGNGIKELNEFELANFAYEANYLRVFVPSTEFVRVFSNQFSSALDIRPSVKWGDAKGLKGFVGKLSNTASFRVDRRTGTDDLATALNPFLLDLLDTNLTAQTASARNTFYYDRTSRVWSVDHTWQNDRSRTLLLNGFESRTRQGNTLRLRVNATRRWTMDLESERGRNTNSSDLLDGRTWNVTSQGLRPRITWQPNTSVRAALSYRINDRRNLEEFGGERADTRDLGLEVRYNTAGKGSINGQLNLVRIAYDGPVNTPLGNELLQGLRPGTNATWSLVVQRNLSNNLQVDLTYNGRKSQGNPTVHVGGAQVRAFF